MAKTPDNQDPPAQLSGEMLTAHLLGMLKDWNAYGYDLVQRLNESGLGEYNKGSIYRTLRHMEAMGLVSSIWDTSASGPRDLVFAKLVGFTRRSSRHAGGDFRCRHDSQEAKKRGVRQLIHRQGLQEHGYPATPRLIRQTSAAAA